MRWLLPLAAILAFATASSLIDRNPVPLKPPLQQPVARSSQTSQHEPPSKEREGVPNAPVASGPNLNASHANSRTRADTGQSTEGEPKWTDRVQAYTAIAIAGFTLVLAVVSAMQLAHISSTAQAAKDAAKAAQDTLTAMRESESRQAVDFRESLAASQKAADAARDQVAMMRQAIEYSERAWVTVAISHHESLMYGRMGGCSLDVTFFIRNIGKTPAINVRTSAEIFVSHEAATARIDTLLAECRVSDSKSSRMLLPGESYERLWGLTLRSAQLNSVKTSYSTFYPVIMACTTYQTLPNLSLRQTVVTYALSLNKEGGDAGGLLKIGQFISAADLNLSVTRGGRAD